MSDFECRACGYEVHEEFKDDQDDNIAEIECKAILEAIESFDDGVMVNGLNAYDLYYHCKAFAMAKVGIKWEP